MKADQKFAVAFKAPRETALEILELFSSRGISCSLPATKGTLGVTGASSLTIGFKVLPEKLACAADLLLSRGIACTLQPRHPEPSAVTNPLKAKPAEPMTARPQPERSKVKVKATLFGNDVNFSSLRAALLSTLSVLEAREPGTFERLASTKFKNRYVIARNAESLYLKSPHLAKDYATHLGNGWWVDTNLSKTQVIKRVEAACLSASVSFGREVIFHIL